MVSRFNRSYVSVAEEEYRFLVFVRNVKEYRDEEKKHVGLDLGVTQFTDWTDDEMKKVCIILVACFSSCLSPTQYSPSKSKERPHIAVKS